MGFSAENAPFAKRRQESHFRCCKFAIFDADFAIFVASFEILLQVFDF